MTVDEILSLHAGDELDMLVATEVMGLKEGIDLGAFPEHDWKKNEDGTIDYFAMESEYHSGPVCRRCGHSYCDNCYPNGDDVPCVVGAPSYSGEYMYWVKGVLDKVGGTGSGALSYANGKWFTNYEGNIIVASNLSEVVCRLALLRVLDK
jgi:hypothetical protein